MNITDRPPDQNLPENESILAGIFQGMTVYDSEGSEVGKVEEVYMGSGHSDSRGAAQASAPKITAPGFQVFTHALNPADDIPDTLKGRLYGQGFIRVDKQRLFGKDRYVLPDQIADVEGDRVILKVPYRDLTKASW